MGWKSFSLFNPSALTRRQPLRRGKYQPRLEGLEDRLTPTAPVAPVIIEPLVNGQVVSNFDVHMEVDSHQYFDADGHAWQATSWQIRETAQNGGAVVWQSLNVTDELSKQHLHFGDGEFVGTLAGQTSLLFSRDYVLHATFIDSNNEVSVTSTRNFRTSSAQDPIPGLGTWVLREGYALEEVGANYRLPVNIAFVPNAITDPNAAGYNANAPLYYVAELYGSIKVVRVNGVISDYATGLLDYNPTGPISGVGEQGLTGLAVDPVSGDLFVAMLYDPAPVSGDTTHFPKVERLHSTNGGLTMATRTLIKDFAPEQQGQSHQISNVTIGPDGKLYVHMGDGFDASAALNLTQYRGKILRLNLDGSAPTDNPLYNAGDGINATDFIYTYGHRNPFGGAWDASGKHWVVENGNGLDRLVDLVPGQSYGWNGGDGPLTQFARYVWNPATAPVNLTFLRSDVFNGSLFPASMQNHAFVTLSGPTYASGVQANGKRIDEFSNMTSFVNHDSNPTTTERLATAPSTLLKYNGTGRSTLSAIAAGPDGLYFAELYRDDGVGGPTAAGARVFRIRYVDFHPDNLSAGAGNGVVSLNWTGNALATKYNVYRKVEGGNFVLVGANITGTSFTDTTVANGTEYTYSVRGVNVGGESSDSNTVTARPQSGVGQPPIVATPATAVANPAQPTRRINLSVLGADVDEAESSLRYTWTNTSRPAGAAVPTFLSANGVNASKNMTVEVGKAGEYVFQVTIIDSAGFTTTSSVSYTVNQVLSGVSLTPSAATLPLSSTQQFTASGRDQFNDVMATSVDWTLDGGSVGTLESVTATSVVYRAPGSTGAATIRATAGSISGAATVTVSTVIPGLQAEFFDYTTDLAVIPDLTGRTADVTRTDGQVNYASVDTAWTGLDARFADTYASRHSGFINIATAGAYTFYTNSDDGSKLWIDDQLIVNNDGLHGMVEVAGTVNLTAGFHSIRVEFFENGGGAGLIASWSGPGVAKQVIPASVLFLSGAPANQPPNGFSVNPHAHAQSPTTAEVHAEATDPDDAPATLTYTWTYTGPGTVSFAQNGNNAAHETLATFSKAGTYALTITVRDPANNVLQQTFNYTVNQTLTTVAVAPATVTLTTNATQQFTATGRDQFGDLLTTQPTFSWSVDNQGPGTGTISTTGLYTAPPNPNDSVTVRATSGSVTGTASPTIVPATGSGTGLKATFWDNIDFTGASITRTDATINNDWATGSPDAAIGVDTFSSRWEGQIEARFSEMYTFYTTSDDGVRLRINGQLVIDQWNDHAPTTHTGTITLVAGQKYDILMEHYENGGFAVAKLEWSSASQAREIVPQSQLFLPAPPVVPGDGLSATYFDNIDLTGATVTRIDPTINFDWGGGSPSPAIGADTFSARWTGQIQTRYSESYTFYTTSDDGIRLWINNQLVIDQWNDHAPTVHSGEIALTAGQKVDIRLEYFENGGGAVARLEWQSASQAREIVPQSQLFSTGAPVTPPAAPSGLTAAAASSGQINLSWTDNSSNETGFQVDRATDAGFTQNVVSNNVTANVATYAASGLTANTTYFFRVRALNGTPSAFSNTASASTPAAPAGVIRINFQDATSQGFSGYLADTGAVFGDRGNGLSYGWNANNSTTARNRNAAGSPDERYDTLQHMQKPENANAVWEVAVPNGSYTVRIVTGDPGGATDALYKLNAEGVLAIDSVTAPTPGQFFDNTVSVTVSDGRLTVSNATGAQNNKINFIEITPNTPAGLNYSGGFAGATGLTLNGSTAVSGSQLQLTNGGLDQAGSAFSSTAQNVGAFTTQFDFQITNPGADGFAFVIQNVGATALGPKGGGLGYGPDTVGMPAGIISSLAIKFDIYNNGGEGINSTGLFTNGQSPTINGVAPTTGVNDLTGAGVDLRSGHAFRASIGYNGTTLTVTITDLQTSAAATQTYLVNIPGLVGGNTAYVGFTGGTGGLTATQSILNWTFTPQ